MIRITIKSGRYTLDELMKILSPHFSTDDDVDLFITAMQQTNQLIEVEHGVFETAEYKPVVKRKTPLYLEVTPKTGKAREEEIEGISVYHYGGPRNVPAPRVGIRAGAGWTKKHGIPTEIKITKIFKEGRWVPVKETVVISPVPGRSPKTVEAWRAEIPRPIVRKYGITPETPIRIRVATLIRDFFATLQLWGYALLVMIFFGATKGGANPRNLELIGDDFVTPISTNIKEGLMEKSDKVETLLYDWLEKFNPEYYALYEESGDTVEVQEPFSGAGPEPLKKHEARIAKIQFLDPNRMVEKIAIYQTREPYDHIPPLSAFEKVVDNVIYSLKEKRGKTKLIQARLPNVGGF